MDAEVCPACGIKYREERTVRVRVTPRPDASDRCVVTEADTGKDISGFVPAYTPGLCAAQPGETIRGLIYTTDPAHVLPGEGDICSQPTVYEVVR